MITRREALPRRPPAGRSFWIPLLLWLVNEGRIVALLGANGAEKTTTLKAISGLLKVESGELVLDQLCRYAIMLIS